MPISLVCQPSAEHHMKDKPYQETYQYGHESWCSLEIDNPKMGIEVLLGQSGIF